MTGDLNTSRNGGALETRMLRTMIIVSVGTVAVAAVISPWRVTTGLLLGGALSIVNFRWLHSSAKAIINLNIGSPSPSAYSIRYALRYFVVAAAVVAAYQFNIISLAATIAGLCSFVPALMFEAFREFYFIIVHREESV